MSQRRQTLLTGRTAATQDHGPRALGHGVYIVTRTDQIYSGDAAMKIMRTLSYRKRIVFSIAIAVSLLALDSAMGQKRKPGGGDGSPSYNIIKLDDVGGTLDGFAYDINQARLIVGVVNDSVSADQTIARAAYWTVTEAKRSVESRLNLLDGGDCTHTYALGCNEAGEVVGQGDDRALYWPHPQAPPLALPSPTGSVRCGANAISNDGVICGWSASVPGDPADTALAWRVTEDGLWGPLVLETEIPDPNGTGVSATALSDQGIGGVVTIAGVSNDKAMIWTVTLTGDGGLAFDTATNLSPTGQATGVNNLEIVCGNADLDSVNNTAEAAIWIGGAPIPLNVGASSWAARPQDINDEGVIVGYARPSQYAVLWAGPDANMVALDKFLKNSPFSFLTTAHAVSESGEIVGYGWISDTASHAAFLALPK